MFRNTFKAALTASVALGSLAFAAPVMAQDNGTQVQTVDDIVVTARRREESLQETPLAIAAVTSEELKSARIERLADLAKIAPGLSFTPLFGAQNQLPIIRGAAQTFGQLNVGVFLDGVYLSGKAGVDLEMAALERIEVVRGPQSALYGQNTFAGAINYISQRPSAVMTGDLEATVGDNGLYKFTGGLSGPITEDLGFRIGAYSRQFDGWYESAIDGGKIDYSETYGFSGTLDWAPSDRFSAVLRASYSEEDSGQPASVVVRNNVYPATPAGAHASITRNLLYMGELGPVDKDAIYVNTRHVGGEVGDYGTRQDTFRTNLTLDYDFGPAALTSITAYSKRNAEYTYDGDNTICDRAGGCPNFGWPFAPPLAEGSSGLATSSAVEAYTDFSQELRLASTGDTRLSWLLGAYYYKGEVDAVQRSLSGFANPATVAAFGFPRMITDTESLSVFGSLSYDVTDKFSTTFELRYQQEDQTYSQAPTSATATDPATIRVLNLSESFDFVTPRLILNYQIEPGKMVYGSIARGAKTGGFNTNINIFDDQRTFDPEYSWNYELGGKFDWLDRRLRTNIALFYTAWEDQQTACQNEITAFPGSNSTQRTYTCNVAEATVYGLELDGTLRVSDVFTIVGSYAYTHARYDSFVDDSLAGTLAQLGLPAWDFEGRSLPYVPDHRLTVSPRINVHAFGDYDFEGRLDVQHQTKTFVRADNMQHFDAKTTVDLRLALRSDRLSYQFFVNNLFDDDTPTAAVRFYDATNYSVASPLVTAPDRRLIGFTVGYQF